MKVKTIENVFSVREIIHKLPEDFFGILSDDAPFSWSDNDHSLVYISRFIDHIEDRKKYLGQSGFDKEVDNLIQWLYKTKEVFGEETFIDLEN